MHRRRQELKLEWNLKLRGNQTTQIWKQVTLVRFSRGRYSYSLVIVHKTSLRLFSPIWTISVFFEGQLISLPVDMPFSSMNSNSKLIISKSFFCAFKTDSINVSSFTQSSPPNMWIYSPLECSIPLFIAEDNPPFSLFIFIM